MCDHLEEVTRGLRGERETAVAAALFGGLDIVPLCRAEGDAPGMAPLAGARHDPAYWVNLQSIDDLARRRPTRPFSPLAAVG